MDTNIKYEKYNGNKLLIEGNKIDLKEYEKEEGGGFYYKKHIVFNTNTYNLFGVGCRYKMLLSLYSVGLYCVNIPEELSIQNSINKIVSCETHKMLLIKIYRDIDILSLTSSLNKEFKKRVDTKILENKDFSNNLLYLEWILKKYIDNGLRQYDELVFEWNINKMNIYIGKNNIEINSSYFYERIKDNLTPTNKFKKIGEIEDAKVCKLLFECYLDNNSVTPDIKYSINKYILNLSGIQGNSIIGKTM